MVEEFLVTEIAKTGNYSVIGRDDISRMITHEEERQKLGCYDDACLAEIGEARGFFENIPQVARILQACASCPTAALLLWGCRWNLSFPLPPPMKLSVKTNAT